MTSHHIIFDCDGVLVDSEPLSMQVDVEILAENGVNISDEEAHARFVGKTFAAMIDEIASETGAQFPADTSAHKDLRLLALYERELKVVPGVADALHSIGHHHYSVASNSPAERVEAALRITGLTPFSAIASPLSNMWPGQSPRPTSSRKPPAAPAIRPKIASSSRIR